MNGGRGGELFKSREKKLSEKASANVSAGLELSSQWYVMAGLSENSVSHGDTCELRKMKIPEEK